MYSNKSPTVWPFAPITCPGHDTLHDTRFGCFDLRWRMSIQVLCPSIFYRDILLTFSNILHRIHVYYMYEYIKYNIHIIPIWHDGTMFADSFLLILSLPVAYVSRICICIACTNDKNVTYQETKTLLHSRLIRWSAKKNCDIYRTLNPKNSITVSHNRTHPKNMHPIRAL